MGKGWLNAYGERLLAQLIQLVQANPWIAAGIAALGLIVLLIKRRAA
ncbi:hypothetical protein M1O52_00615 [Dehalococcoidia bacterium]|nr:hypothetical protein [Dehalococcoidia bacterium]